MITLNPKKRFLEHASLVQAHQGLVDNPMIQDFLQLSLAHMASSQSSNAEGPVAARDHYKLEGAREFIHIFLNLSSKPEERTPITSGTLRKENPKL